MVQHIRFGGFVQQMQQVCPRCHGQGRTISKPCPKCRGHGVFTDDINLLVPISPGTPSNTVVTLPEAGHQQPHHISGDVRVTLKERNGTRLLVSLSTLSAPTKTRKENCEVIREGQDLNCRLSLSLEEALMGFTLDFSHLDKRAVTYTQHEVTGPDSRLRLPGEGMPRFVQADTQQVLEAGDFWFSFEVKLRKIHPKQLEVLLDVLGNS